MIERNHRALGINTPRNESELRTILIKRVCERKDFALTRRSHATLNRRIVYEIQSATTVISTPASPVGNTSR